MVTDTLLLGCILGRPAAGWGLRTSPAGRAASCLDTWQPRVRAVQYPTGSGVCGSLRASWAWRTRRPACSRPGHGTALPHADLPPSWPV